MKKILSIIISSIVVAALAVGLIFIIINVNNEKEFNLTVGASVGGDVQIVIDDTVTDVSANHAKTQKTKTKTKIELTAIASLGYEFVNWEVNGDNDLTAETIEIEISEETDVYANFKLSNIPLTVVDGEFTEVFDYSPANNLLSSLQTKYVADKGYMYTYKIGETEVNENTVITKATTISRKKVEITYSVVFKHNDEQVGDTQFYTISTIKNVAAPEIPEFENSVHYKDVAWEEFDLSSLGNKVVHLTKTPIEYFVEFKHNDEIIETKSYTIENSNIELPAISAVSEMDYHTFGWPEYKLTYSTETIVVNTIITPIKNTIFFTDTEGKDVAKIDFTKEQFEKKDTENLFQTPEIAETVEHFTLSWSEDLNNILNGELDTYCGKKESIVTTIETIKTPIIYSVTFSVNGKDLTSEEVKNNGGDNEFTAEDLTICAPNITESTSDVFYSFGSTALTQSDLGKTDIVINAEKYLKVTFKRIKMNKTDIDSIYAYVKITDNGIALNEDETVTLYSIPYENPTPTVINNTAFVSSLSTHKSLTPKTVSIGDSEYDASVNFGALVDNVIKKAIKETDDSNPSIKVITLTLGSK